MIVNWKTSQMDLKSIQEALNAITQPDPTANQSGGSSQPATQTAAQLAPQLPEPRTFWTSCKTCGFYYEHFRFYLNRILLCPNCNQPFQAVESQEPETSLDFMEAKDSGRFPWGPLERNAASSSGIVLDGTEVETQSRKRKRTVVKKMVEHIDFDEMKKERGRIYIAKKLEWLNQQ